jgi:hypothetical protein
MMPNVTGFDNTRADHGRLVSRALAHSVSDKTMSRNTRRAPFVRMDGVIEWPRGWTAKDAKAWRKANGQD